MAKKKKKASAKIKTLNAWYAKQLEAKEKEIKKLKAENTVLLATALKQSKKTQDIFQRAEKAMKKKK